jgi:hypothetical protein
MENTSKSLTLGLKRHQGKAEELKKCPWIDRKKLGSIAALDRSPEPWIDCHRSFQKRKRSLTADDSEMIFLIKDCGLVGYGGRQNLFSKDS